MKFLFVLFLKTLNFMDWKTTIALLQSVPVVVAYLPSHGIIVLYSSNGLVALKNVAYLKSG